MDLVKSIKGLFAPDENKGPVKSAFIPNVIKDSREAILFSNILNMLIPTDGAVSLAYDDNYPTLYFLIEAHPSAGKPAIKVLQQSAADVFRALVKSDEDKTLVEESIMSERLECAVKENIRYLSLLKAVLMAPSGLFANMKGAPDFKIEADQPVLGDIKYTYEWRKGTDAELDQFIEIISRLEEHFGVRVEPSAVDPKNVEGHSLPSLERKG